MMAVCTSVGKGRGAAPQCRSHHRTHTPSTHHHCLLESRIWHPQSPRGKHVEGGTEGLKTVRPLHTARYAQRPL